MPVYDYKCAMCGERTEHIVLEGDKPPKKCAACGGSLKRAWGGGRVGVRFEGWGFSKTDGLIGDSRGPRKDFKQLRERAERIRDE